MSQSITSRLLEEVEASFDDLDLSKDTIIVISKPHYDKDNEPFGYNKIFYSYGTKLIEEVKKNRKIIDSINDTLLIELYEADEYIEDVNKSDIEALLSDVLEARKFFHL